MASASVRGGAPATRETALLAADKTVERVHALCLSGGSAFGLAAAQGVSDWLAERGVGYPTPFAPIPIVPAAAIYDLGGASTVRYPDARAGYQAAARADTQPLASGRVGVGARAMCSGYAGPDKSYFGGLGHAAMMIDGAIVAAMSVANPYGDVVDPDSGEVIAGTQRDTGVSPLEQLQDYMAERAAQNTTLVVLATDAVISKTQAYTLAEAAHVGIARAIRPSHTPFDGDAAFALSTGRGPEVALFKLVVVGQAVVAQAIVAGARAANLERA